MKPRIVHFVDSIVIDSQNYTSLPRANSPLANTAIEEEPDAFWFPELMCRVYKTNVKNVVYVDDLPAMTKYGMPGVHAEVPVVWAEPKLDKMAKAREAKKQKAAEKLLDVDPGKIGT